MFVQPWFISLLLAVATFAVFRSVSTFPFVELDDHAYVMSNPHVQGGLTAENVIWAFGACYSSNWHPLTWLSHMLDVELFGSGAAGPHLVNLLFHIANTLLLFAFLRRTTGALWRSALVAGLFALHPLHVESVAWVAERKDVLSTFCGLLALIAYARFTQTSGARQVGRTKLGAAAATPKPGRSPRFYYALALGWFALGLTSKPMLVSLPILLLLLDYWPLGRFGAGSAREAWDQSRGLVLEKVPFLGLALASCVVTLVAQSQGGAVQSLEHYSIGERVGNALVAYARYLGKTLWPERLSVFYPHPGHWPRATVMLAALLLAALCATAIRVRRPFPYALTGWFWFVIALVPVIGLVQVGGQSLADRYSYLPLIGLLVVLSWGGAEVLARYRVSKALAVGVSALALAACAGRTIAQLPNWRDTETLYRHALAVTGDNPVVRHFLGDHYYDEGNSAKAAGRLDEAISFYRRSNELNSQYGPLHNNLGMALQLRGQIAEAIQEYQMAVQLSPTNANARNNLGVAMASIGKVDEAISQMAEVVRLTPDNPGAHNNLGALFARQGKFSQAIAEYEESARLAPGNPAVYDNLGDALARLGRREEALANYRRALQASPNDPVAIKRLQGAPSGTPATAP